MPTTPLYGWPTPGPSDPPDIPKDMTALAMAIEATLSAQLTALAPGPWIAIPLSAAYRAYDAARRPSYRIEPNPVPAAGSIIRLAGWVSAVTGNVVSGATLATMPVGTRPPATIAAAAGASTAGTGLATVRLAVTSAGLINVVATPTTGFSTWVALDGIAYSTSSLAP